MNANYGQTMPTEKMRKQDPPKTSKRLIKRIYEAGFRVRTRYRSGKPFYVIYQEGAEKAGFWNRQEACIFLVAETMLIHSKVNP